MTQDGQNIFEPQPKKSNVNRQKISIARTPKKSGWSLNKRKAVSKKKKPKITLKLSKDFGELLPSKKKEHFYIRKLKHHLICLNYHEVQGRETNKIKRKKHNAMQREGQSNKLLSTRNKQK